MSLVLSMVENNIARVVINRPEKLNAMNSALIAEFIAVFATLAADPDLRAVVLTGAGPKSFVGGADIAEMGAIDSPGQARAFITSVHRCCDAVRSLPVPVIARIQGFCFGAGLELAVACDLRVAAESASFGMQEVKLGIPSVIEAALLPGLVGWGRTREMLLLGETFAAADAARWNLIERVVPDADLDGAVADWLAKLLTSAPQAVRNQKALIRRWEKLPLAEAIQAGIDSFAQAFDSDEPKQALGHFLAAAAARKAGKHGV
jgi:enoyl-CoA hydratase